MRGCMGWESEFADPSLCYAFRTSALLLEFATVGRTLWCGEFGEMNRFNSCFFVHLWAFLFPQSPSAFSILNVCNSRRVLFVSAWTGDLITRRDVRTLGNEPLGADIRMLSSRDANPRQLSSYLASFQTLSISDTVLSTHASLTTS